MPLLDTPISPPQNEKGENHHNNWPNEAGFTASKEQRQPRLLTTVGKIPTYAAGSLFRTGPGTYRVKTKDNGEYACSHWFDGFTYIHKFNIIVAESGSVNVEYSSRCQVDNLLEEARNTGKLDGMSFGQKRDPCDSYFKKVKSVFHAARRSRDGTDYTNVGVVVVKTPGKSTSESMTVATDASVVKQFDSTTLEPFGVASQRSLHPDLKGPISGAHAGIDPVTGDFYNYNIDLGPKITYRIFKTDGTTGSTEILATFSESDIQAAYIHSIFITENFVVLCIWPAYYGGRGASILWEQNFLDAMRFDTTARTNWIVVDRKHGRGVVNRFTSDPIFAFHFVNGWEQKNDQGGIDIVCDLVEYKNTDILHKFYYENLVSNSAGANKWTVAARPSLNSNLKRYRLPSINTDSKHAPSSRLPSPHPAETLKSVPGPYCGDLPRVNESLMTKPHRYVYGVAARDLSSFVDGLVKTDMDSADPESTSLTWSHPKHSPGEPIFIQNPEGNEEDDGVILSVVLNGEKGTSYLLCLDAKTMTEVGRAEVEAAVGFGFHGVHIIKGTS